MKSTTLHSIVISSLSLEPIKDQLILDQKVTHHPLYGNILLYFHKAPEKTGSTYKDVHLLGTMLGVIYIGNQFILPPCCLHICKALNEQGDSCKREKCLLLYPELPLHPVDKKGMIVIISIGGRSQGRDSISCCSWLSENAEWLDNKYLPTLWGPLYWTFELSCALMMHK